MNVLNCFSTSMVLPYIVTSLDHGILCSDAFFGTINSKNIGLNFNFKNTAILHAITRTRFYPLSPIPTDIPSDTARTANFRPLHDLRKPNRVGQFDVLLQFENKWEFCPNHNSRLCISRSDRQCNFKFHWKRFGEHEKWETYGYIICIICINEHCARGSHLSQANPIINIMCVLTKLHAYQRCEPNARCTSSNCLCVKVAIAAQTIGAGPIEECMCNANTSGSSCAHAQSHIELSHGYVKVCGRTATSSLFSHHQHGISPDIRCLSNRVRMPCLYIHLIIMRNNC